MRFQHRHLRLPRLQVAASRILDLQHGRHRHGHADDELAARVKKTKGGDNRCCEFSVSAREERNVIWFAIQTIVRPLLLVLQPNLG